MFGPESCLPFRVSSTPSAEVIDALLEAAKATGAFVRIDPGRTQEGVQAVLQILPALRGASRIALVASPDIAEVIVRECGERSPDVVTIRVDAEVTLDEVRSVANLVKRYGAILEFTVEAQAAHLREPLRALGPWRVLDDDREYELRGGVLAIAPDGHVEQQTRSGIKRSPSTVQSVGLEAAMAELGLDVGAFGFDHGPIHLPIVSRVPEPDGQGEYRYYGGGSQAHACWYQEEATRAAFGFFSTERDAYARWLSDEVGDGVESVGLPGLPFLDPRYGLQLAGKEERLLLPPRLDMPNHRGRSLSAALAAEVARGHVQRVASCLGVLDHHEDPDGSMRRFGDLHQTEKEALLKRAAGLLTSCIEIIAVSRAPQDLRSRAVLALLTLGCPEARPAIRRLQVRVPEVAEAAARKAGKRSTRARFKRYLEPELMEKFIRETIAELQTVFGQGGRHA